MRHEVKTVRDTGEKYINVYPDDKDGKYMFSENGEGWSPSAILA